MVWCVVPFADRQDSLFYVHVAVPRPWIFCDPGFKGPPSHKAPDRKQTRRMNKNRNDRACLHGLGIHGGGGRGKTNRTNRADARPYIRPGAMCVWASQSWARPAPRSKFFYLTGRAANRPSSHMYTEPAYDCLLHMLTFMALFNEQL